MKFPKGHPARSNMHMSLVCDELLSAQSAERHMVHLVEVFTSDYTWSQVLSMYSWFLN